MSEAIKKAVITLCQELKKDEGYYISWKATIAMALYDEYRKSFEVESGNIHKIANDAADNFLKLLIGQSVQSPETQTKGE